MWYYEYAVFEIQINGETLCTAWGESSSSSFADEIMTFCSAAAYAAEGKMLMKVTLPELLQQN